MRLCSFNWLLQMRPVLRNKDHTIICSWRSFCNSSLTIATSLNICFRQSYSGNLSSFIFAWNASSLTFEEHLCLSILASFPSSFALIAEEGFHQLYLWTSYTDISSFSCFLPSSLFRCLSDIYLLLFAFFLYFWLSLSSSVQEVFQHDHRISNLFSLHCRTQDLAAFPCFLQLSNFGTEFMIWASVGLCSISLTVANFLHFCRKKNGSLRFSIEHLVIYPCVGLSPCCWKRVFAMTSDPAKFTSFDLCHSIKCTLSFYFYYLLLFYIFNILVSLISPTLSFKVCCFHFFSGRMQRKMKQFLRREGPDLWLLKESYQPWKQKNLFILTGTQFPHV